MLGDDLSRMGEGTLLTLRRLMVSSSLEISLAPSLRFLPFVAVPFSACS